MTYKFEFYGELCCDDCNEVIHNHFDCPVCDVKYAGTSMYHDTYDMRLGSTFDCESCGAEFKLMSKVGSNDEFEWERVTAM